MTPDLEALARRAVACKGWRWLPGMRWTVLRAAPLEHITDRIGGVERTQPAWWTPYQGVLPDLSDPATLGCLLALVREAWDDPAIHCAPALYRDNSSMDGAIAHWHCYAPRAWNPNTDPRPCSVVGPTEAAALIAALEAAP